MNARPVRAAIASVGVFAVGAALPLCVAFVASSAKIVLYIAIMSFDFLAFFGGLAAKVGGANIWSTMRAAFWGALAMAAPLGSPLYAVKW